ncbi:hypothetical protein [Metamycoplasma buccale]|uniref:hypothetical protein n=1 Tax=Metamycoplasma buccale TaxID=55602 RepID=UPI00398ED445
MQIKIGKIIKAKVVKVWKNVIILITKDNEKCHLNINEISDYFIKDISSMFEVGDIKEIQVIDIMPNHEYLVSFKKIHPKELRNPFSFRMDKDNTNFEALLDFTNKGLRYGK